MATPQSGQEAFDALTAKPPDKQKVYAMLQAGLNPNEWHHPETGDTLMHTTAKRFSHSMHEALAKLVEHGANVDALNKVVPSRQTRL